MFKHGDKVIVINCTCNLCISFAETHIGVEGVVDSYYSDSNTGIKTGYWINYQSDQSGIVRHAYFFVSELRLRRSVITLK